MDSFRGVEYSASVANYFTPENLQPTADWHPRIPGIVYWGTIYNMHIAMNIYKFNLYSRNGLAVSWLQFSTGKTAGELSWTAHT